MTTMKLVCATAPVSQLTWLPHEVKPHEPWILHSTASALLLAPLQHALDVLATTLQIAVFEVNTAMAVPSPD
jgi:hypothetical protein